MSEDEKKRVTLRFDPKLASAIELYAHREGRSVTDLIERMVRQLVEDQSENYVGHQEKIRDG